MEPTPNPPVIAVLNGTAEILETMEEYLRTEGFTTITAIVTEFKKGKEDFVQFIEDHNPTIILYDIPPPYDQNLTFLRLLTDTHSMDNRCLILTTTNKAQLEKITGEKAALEIVGKPYDMDILIKTIREKLKHCEETNCRWLPHGKRQQSA